MGRKSEAVEDLQTNAPAVPDGAAKESKPNGRALVEQDQPEPSFWDRIAQLTDADWENKYWLYLYRMLPKVDLGETHFTARLNTPGIDEAEILARFGSGKYHAKLNDRKKHATIAALTFSVYDPAIPPRCDLSQMLKCPENEPYFAWLKKKPANPGGPAPTEEGETTAAKAAVEEMAAITKQALRAKDTSEEPRQADVSETVADLLKDMAKGRDDLAAKIAEQQRSAAAQPATLDPLAALDRAVDLIKKLQPAQPVAEPESRKGIVDQATELLELFGRLKETLTPAGATPGAAADPAEQSLTSTIIQNTTELLKGPLAILTQAFVAKLMAAPAVPRPGLAPQAGIAAPVPAFAGAPPTPVAPGQVDEHAAAIAQFERDREAALGPFSGVPGPATPRASAVAPAIPEPPQDPQQAILAGIVHQLAPLLLNAFAGGSDGYQFAEGVITLYGRLAYDQAVGIGKERIAAAIKSDPGLWGQLAPIEARFNEFLDEFFTYDAWMQEQEEGEQELEPRNSRRRAA